MHLRKAARFIVCCLYPVFGGPAVRAEDAPAATVTVDPARCVIVASASEAATPREADLLREAVAELQLHLQLVTGARPAVVEPGAVPEGFHVFHVGTAPAGAADPLAAQETRWTTAADATHLYGETSLDTLFAVYGFLQDQLAIDWIRPGDEGISFRARNPLTLRTGTFAWTPQLRYRSIRQGVRPLKGPVQLSSSLQPYKEFLPAPEAHQALVDDVVQWKRRMRMGGSRPGGGHAFSDWWEKYGATHPDYFALNKSGKREPVPLPKAGQTESFIKICPSNPRVVEQLIADWLPRKDRSPFIDVGVNDGTQNFCECEQCRALDAPREGEAWDAHLTDRYVHLANAVAREARKHRPDACATMYAYMKTLYPPRRLKLETNIVVQLVPYVDPLDLDIVREHFEGWKKAGATQLMLRPNYHFKYMTSTLPLGIEQQMFDVLQLAITNGCVATDYDSLFNNWPVTGLSDFALARAMADPTQPFEHWAQRYYAAFGAAAADVQAYHEYWRRELWQGRLQPDLLAICRAGGAGDFSRGLFWSLGNYYRLADFEETDRILDRASQHTLTPVERTRLTQLQLANEHARLLFQAVVAKPEDKSDFAAPLLAFRRRHKENLPLQWIGVFSFEIGNGDLTGLQISDTMRDYLKPWLQTDLFWKFSLDPKDVGLAEQWFALDDDALDGWLDFRTDRFWEQQFEADEQHNLPEDVAARIFSYDGIGWYATRLTVPDDWKGRHIFLRFGAVDESCWVHVNGRLAGEHLYRVPNDWKTPFEIRIDPLVDWSQPRQRIVVRVEDKGGMGGMWRRVWLVSKAAEAGAEAPPAR